MANPTLRKSGLRQKLAGQPFEVLRVLLERPQKIVTREELQQRIWPTDTFVDYDLALRKAITRVREALGDSAESPRFIETIPRRGYRFIAPVSSAEGGMTGQERSVSPQIRKRGRRLRWTTAIVAASVLAAVATGIAVSALRRHGRGAVSLDSPIRSLAVLPLTNLSGDPAQEYFGMTDALITDLARISSVRVISRTSVMHCKKTDKTLSELARELNVDGVIEGTVQHSAERVRITVQLVHAIADKHLWAESYERDEHDILTLEGDLAQEIADRIQVRIATPGPTPARQASPANDRALDAYLRGNYYLTRGEWSINDEEKRRAATYFEQAVDADPDLSPAYIGLASAHDNLFVGSSDDIATRRRAAEKALELDPNSSEPWEILAVIKWFDFDWSGAEQDHRRAVGLNVNNADAHDGLGTFLAAMGHFEEALREGAIAQELDPNQDHLSSILEMRGEHRQAIELLRRLADTYPDDGIAHYNLYRNYAELGLHEDAVRELESACKLFGLRETASNLRRGFAVSNYRGAMREWAKALEQLQASRTAFAPENLAYAYLASGDRDRAFYWLNQAYTHRENVSHDFGLGILKEDRLLDPLRSDPRFAELLRRVGLPP